LAVVAIVLIIVSSIFGEIATCTPESGEDSPVGPADHNYSSASTNELARMQHGLAQQSAEIEIALHSCVALGMQRGFLCLLLLLDTVLLAVGSRFLRRMELALPEVALIPEGKMIVATLADPDDVAPDFVFSRIQTGSVV